MTTGKGTTMTNKADDAKRPTGRPRKYDVPPKARNVALQPDVHFWLSATSVTTGIPVSTLINSIIRSYILSPESDVYRLPASHNRVEQ